MTRLRIEPSPYRARTGLRSATLGLAAGGIAVALLLVLSARLVDDPDRVARVRVTNPTTYQLEVSVGSPERTGAQNLGTVQRDSSRQFDELLDQGERWLFRFSYGGVSAGETVVTRAQLERDRWTVSAPPAASELLAAEEMVPSSR